MSSSQLPPVSPLQLWDDVNSTIKSMDNCNIQHFESNGNNMKRRVDIRNSIKVAITLAF